MHARTRSSGRAVPRSCRSSRAARASTRSSARSTRTCAASSRSADVLTCDHLVTYCRGMDDEVFRALADLSRRRLLDRLFERDGQTLTELERTLPAMTRFGVMKHLRVLEEAGLVVTRRAGREKYHYLNAVPIRQLHDRWIDKYRARTADALLDLKASLEDPMNATTAPATAADAPPAHVFTVFIRTTPDALWHAITESKFTLRYYYSSTVESDWRPGSHVAYKIAGQDAIVGTAIEVDPPRRLSMTFDAR